MDGVPTNGALSVGATHDCQYERKRSCRVLHRQDEGSTPNRGIAESKSIRGPLCYSHLAIFFWLWPGASLLVNYCATAVLPKIPHSISCKRVPNRPLRPRRGRFGTLLQLLECGSFRRTAVYIQIQQLTPFWRPIPLGGLVHHLPVGLCITPVFGWRGGRCTPNHALLHVLNIGTPIFTPQI